MQWSVNQNKIAVGFLESTFYSLEKVISLLDEKPAFFCHCFTIFEIFFVQHFQNKTRTGLRISRKDRKHMSADRLFKLSACAWSSHSCNDRRYSYFARNICNRYVDSFKSHFL